jgi:hypothetical protein
MRYSTGNHVRQGAERLGGKTRQIEVIVQALQPLVFSEEN